ncbi:MAG: hypothetical protein R3B96_17235 [Pirellulaceae bacterium]
MILRACRRLFRAWASASAACLSLGRLGSGLGGGRLLLGLGGLLNLLGQLLEVARLSLVLELLLELSRLFEVSFLASPFQPTL